MRKAKTEADISAKFLYSLGAKSLSPLLRATRRVPAASEEQLSHRFHDDNLQTIIPARSKSPRRRRTVFPSTKRFSRSSSLSLSRSLQPSSTKNRPRRKPDENNITPRKRRHTARGKRSWYRTGSDFNRNRSLLLADNDDSRWKGDYLNGI